MDKLQTVKSAKNARISLFSFLVATVRVKYPELKEASAELAILAKARHLSDLSTLQVLIELSKNPITAFGARAYREPYIYSRSRVQHFLMVNDPDGITRHAAISMRFLIQLA